MRLLTFTHANLKTPIQVVDSQIYSFYYSQGHGATHLLATGGAIVPITETMEQVASLLKTVVTKPTKGKTTNEPK